MKNINGLLGKALLVFAALTFAGSIMAAEEDEDEKKKNCKKPKFYDFTPKHLSEVVPGSEISFKVARAKSPEFVHLEVKKIPVKLQAENNDLFYVMTGKLPAELHGTYARVNIRAEGDGGCHVEDGWLLKILDGQQTAAPHGTTPREETSKDASGAKENPPQTKAANADTPKTEVSAAAADK